MWRAPHSPLHDRMRISGTDVGPATLPTLPGAAGAGAGGAGAGPGDGPVCVCAENAVYWLVRSLGPAVDVHVGGREFWQDAVGVL